MRELKLHRWGYPEDEHGIYFAYLENGWTAWTSSWYESRELYEDGGIAELRKELEELAKVNNLVLDLIDDDPLSWRMLNQ